MANWTLGTKNLDVKQDLKITRKDRAFRLFRYVIKEINKIYTDEVAQALSQPDKRERLNSLFLGAENQFLDYTAGKCNVEALKGKFDDLYIYIKNLKEGIYK
jgi:hypothetical protein